MATAYRHAYHQVSSEPRIFTDPLAVRIVGADPETIVNRVTATLRMPGSDPALPSLFLAARSRFAEETVAAAAADGTRQVVILGAGLDTFGYRNPHEGLRVFEVDHPDTQAFKRSRLADAQIAIPDSLTFAPADLGWQPLERALAAAGFDRAAPAVFLWLGVMTFLTEEAITAMLRFIVGQDAAVRLVMDYLYPPDGEQSRLSFFTAEQIGSVLSAVGFDAVEDVAGPTLVARYLDLSEAEPDAAPPHIVRACRS